MVGCCERAVDEGRESESSEMAVLGRKEGLDQMGNVLKSRASQSVATVIHRRFTNFRRHMIAKFDVTKGPGNNTLLFYIKSQLPCLAIVP